MRRYVAYNVLSFSFWIAEVTLIISHFQASFVCPLNITIAVIMSVPSKLGDKVMTVTLYVESFWPAVPVTVWNNHNADSNLYENM